MKKLLPFMLLLVLKLQIIAQCVEPENVYSFTFDGKTYEIIKDKKSWTEAATCAIERGGYLAEINNQDEQNAIYDAITNGAQIPYDYVSISNGGSIAYIWIGATDQQTEGEWLWDGNNDGEGTQFFEGNYASGNIINNAYNNWGGTSTSSQREPDNYNNGQHYGAIGLNGWPNGTGNFGVAGEWNDIIGSSKLFFVVEINTQTKIEKEKNNELHLYPNPSYGTLKINDPYEKIEMFSINGLMLESFSNEETIDISSYDNGVYFFRVTSEKETSTQKIILKK